MLRDVAAQTGSAIAMDRDAPRISVVVPLGGWNEDARRSVAQIGRLLGPEDECILVPDGFLLHEETPAGCRVVPLAAHGGPAAARNAGARAAFGDILFFVDADVVLADDAMAIVRAHFGRDGADALFGSYDDAPAAATAVSRFRNLLHHFQHQSHAGPARSFWTGCGAIRRSVFEALGGFATSYDRPAMEDVELGARLARAGGDIRLDPALQCKHLKRWTLRSMIITDVRDRAIPWSRLIYRDGDSVAVLNTDPRGRLSLALTALLIATLALGLVLPALWLVALAAWLALAALQRSFLALLQRRGGIGLAAAGALLLPVHLACGLAGFGYVSVERVLMRLRDALHAAGP